MNPAQLATLISAITALVTAVGTIIGIWRHVNGPSHNISAAIPSPEQVAAAKEKWQRTVDEVVRWKGKLP